MNDTDSSTPKRHRHCRLCLHIRESYSKNINPGDFTGEEFLYAQEHLRITSFCYGLLRPLDGIKPYRLEGNVSLPETGTDSMFEYWKSRLTQPLLSEIRKNGNILFKWQVAK